MAYSFPEAEQGRVHEAPVYIAETNELVFADTSLVGLLYALDVDTSQVCISFTKQSWFHFVFLPITNKTIKHSLST